jgi:hypothetical protein
LVTASFDPARSQARQLYNLVGVSIGKPWAGHPVYYANRAKPHSSPRHDGRSGIETDMWLPGDEWIVCKPRISRRVVHNQRAIACDYVCAERSRARRSVDLNSRAAVDHLVELSDQRNQCHRRFV